MRSIYQDCEFVSNCLLDVEREFLSVRGIKYEKAFAALIAESRSSGARTELVGQRLAVIIRINNDVINSHDRKRL